MPNLTRRAVLTAAPLIGALGGCVSGFVSGPRARASLRNLVGHGSARALPAAGFVLMRDRKILASAAEGVAGGLSPDEQAPLRHFTTYTPFRAASISKLATALTAQRLAAANGYSLDAPLEDPLFAARPPSAPPLTLRRLLSHTSGISDPETYWIAAPGHIRDLLGPDIYKMQDEQTPWFEYANLNYGIVATLLEQASGKRFDLLARDFVFAPLDMDAGFNWAGMAPAWRRKGASLYRKTDGVWTVQTDGAEILNAQAPAILSAPDYNLATYTPGTNGTLFSPQGGLRASLVDLAKLASALKTAPDLTEEVWRLNTDRTNGQHEDGVFLSFGSGVFRHEAPVSPWPGQTMLGHHGEAYGLYAGAWFLPELDLTLAYAVTGTPDGTQPPGGKHPAFNIWEQALVDIARQSIS